MGVTAAVRCTCYEEGRAAPRPVPVRADEHDELVAVDGSAFDAVWSWKQTACIHPGMNAAELDLAWRYMRSLYAELDEGDYPVLSAVVPRWNGFVTSPVDAAAALVELARFEAEHPPERLDRLVDLGDPRRYWHARPGEQLGCFRSALEDGGPVEAGFVSGRFGIWLPEDPLRPVFQAAAVEQRAEGGVVTLTEVPAGAEMRLRTAVFEGARHFAVVTLDVPVGERVIAYPRVLALCEASVRTGHAISWG